ncbi:ABC transporter ATP-binding protein [Ventosimonas gracilis]|uniref:Probable ATP-binding protein YheS n=1 Tax=Ventosimonas gracilis TaxID=1680762 RepID=A0A139SVT9_9GAMM|nr:ATP-binding cassette domain-containing protein [Ventosimonas gracilis]KXU38551.1 ABC transporter ATP-binding protein [Ventosimonas gracilis]
MIKLQNLHLQRAGKALLSGADLTLHAGHKVGLTGANGAGKSSLFALLQGQLAVDAGHLEIPANWRIAHMQQEVESLERLAVDYVLDGDTALRQIQQRLAEAEISGDGAAIAHLHHELESADGYSADARARKLLAGLGFSEAQMNRPVGDFSGGFRMRLNLAQALMCPSDLLLLDEPTNHLDLDAILWLEDWLKSYPGTLLLIAHDRDFLDAVVSHIVQVEQHKLWLYRGGYTAFERARAERLAQQQSAFDKQQAQRAHMEAFVRRFAAKASKARQAQSRLKALQRLQEIAPAHADSPFDFAFREAARAPNPLLHIRDGALAYGETIILQNIQLSLAPGARIGLLGPNGAGKSTLIKALAGSLAPAAGHWQRGEHLAIGYFAQHQLEALDGAMSPLLHLKRIAPQEREQTLRDFLGGFDFRGSRCEEPTVNFSGGEKARLALALIAWQQPNLLLMDEPTNHLDLEMRHALTLALQEFSGAVLLVSHDRHLLKSTCDEFWLVAAGRLETFSGSLDDYARWLTAFRAQQKPIALPVESKEDRREQRQQAAQQRKPRSALKKQAEKLEAQLSKLQEKLAALHQRLADSRLYDGTGKDELRELLAAQDILQGEQEALEEAWLEALEALEAGQSLKRFD